MAGRTLHVRCSTWDQVEVFTTRKLRKGRVLSMKVPYAAETGAAVTLGLELPNGLVIAIDGSVVKTSAVAGDAHRTWIEVELTGWTDEVVGRLRAMAADDQPPPTAPDPEPPPRAAPTRAPTQIPVEELPADERELFQHLSAELRRLRALAVHEVLGVARDAGADEIRRGWMQVIRRHHPDLVARRAAPAISHLAEELAILINRAYDRLRVALVAEGRGVAFGPAISSAPSWLVGFDELESTARPSPLTADVDELAPTGPIAPVVKFAPSAPAIALPPDDAAPDDAPSTLQGGEAFEARARAMLGDGDAHAAQEVLAAALCVYPRSRPLRSLYYVASALGALEKGEVMLATSQLETALAHHEECTEAAQILEHVRRDGAGDTEPVWRLFQRGASA